MVSGYVLTWKGGRTGGPRALAPGDGTRLRPDTLGRLDRASLCAVPIPLGRTRVPLGNLFAVEGTPGDLLTLRAMPPLAGLGSAMARGELVIEGDAGDDLGASMTGGLIRVRGSAGHRVGGPGPCSTRGMRGGEILIQKDAGDHVGFRMRRGLIAVGGRCGSSPGYQMLAGTIVLTRGPFDHPGLGMRRGTIVSLDPNSGLNLGEAFAPDAVITMSSVPAMLILFRRLEDLGFAARPLEPTDRLRFSSGDRFELNRGEGIQCLS